MAYAERRESSKGARYRGFYKDADGRYKSAGTYDAEDRALQVAQEAEEHTAALITGATGGLDPVTRATRTIEEYEPVFLRHHRVEGNAKDTYSGTLRLHVIPFLGKVRLAEMNRTAARNYFTALEKAGRSPNSIRQAKIVLAALFSCPVSSSAPTVIRPFRRPPFRAASSSPATANFRTSRIATSASHDVRLSSRCALPGSRSPECSATDQPLRADRSLITARTYFLACTNSSIRLKHGRSRSSSASRFRPASSAPILAPATAFVFLFATQT